MLKVTEEAFLKARHRITDFVLDVATRLEDTEWFTWNAVESAPHTYEELVDAARYSYARGVPLPVWSGACTNTIYLTEEANHAFRFWHDLLHVRHSKDFGVAGEMYIASLHVKAVAAHFGEDSLESKLMTIDTAGQVLHYMTTGQHVEHQLNFARVALGLPPC